MVRTTVTMPEDVKRMLDERAGGRPIYKMLIEDFLHEPDTLSLVKLKIEETEKRITERVDIIERKCDILLQTQKAMMTRVEQGFDEVMRNVFNLIACSAMTMDVVDHAHPGQSYKDAILGQAPAEGKRLFNEWKQGKLK